jgi:hypothetical protein
MITVVDRGGTRAVIAAVHESLPGTFRTSRDARVELAFGGKAEVLFRGREVR